MQHPSGWFPDPLGRYDHRYFNGVSWTSDVSSGGQRLVDPLGVTPSGPGYGSTKGGNGAATAAVVMGSISLVFAWMPFFVVVGLTLAVLAIVFGVRGRRRSQVVGLGGSAATAGTVMGVLGVAASIVGIWLTVLVWNEVIDFVEPASHTVEATSCEPDGRRVVVDGELTNLDDVTRSFVVFVEVDGSTAATSLTDVAPGATETWSVTLRTRSALDSCDADVTVQGPFPFGIEMDPVNAEISP